MRPTTLLAILAILSSAMPLGSAFADDAPRVLKWAELRPAVEPDAAKAPKPFFAGADPTAAQQQDGPPPPPISEGKFMSMKRRQPGANKPPAVVADLNGKRVAIGGYVVPLDFDATTVKEFLLVPFVGACIHVPPPPANQIVYVKADKGFEIGAPFDPVTVTGLMKTDTAFTGLADAAYTIEGAAVEPRTE